MTVPISTAVANASDQPVIEAGAARIGSLHSTVPFLPPTSRVVNGNAVTFAESLWGISTPPQPDFDELANYLVLAASYHTLDGWRYLSHAALALLSGARNQALHYAYYAELRAALSILASAGIGILNRKHFALTGSNTVNWFKGLTHSVAWEALKEWAQLRPNAFKVIGCFEAFNISAREWAEACSATLSLDAIAAGWLKDWSIDLASLKSDSTLRNEASYRPNLRATALDQVALDEVQFVLDICDSYNLMGQGHFESIDLVVVSDLCQKACKLNYGDSNALNMKKLWNVVFKWVLANKRRSIKDIARIIQHLRNAYILSGGKIMTAADITNQNERGVISRASLLLRLSAALKRQQWDEINIRAAGGVSPWQRGLLSSYAVCANLWDVSHLPVDYSTLDADRIVAQEKLSEWVDENPIFNPHKMWRDKSKELVDLCRFERIGVLAVAP